MASIKLSIATTTKNDGTRPLYFILSHGNRTARIATGVSIAPEQWDKKKLQVTNHPQKKQLNLMLAQRKFDIEQTLYNIAASRSVRSLSATQLKDAILASMSGEDSTVTIRDIFTKFIAKKTRPNTIKTFEATLRHMNNFDSAILDKRIEEINYDWLSDFANWLKCGTNATNLYLSKIRAVYNYAIDCEYTTAYPFRKIRLKKERTKKRNLSANKLREIIFCDEYTEVQQVYVDFFALQFLLIGINVVDLMGDVRIHDGRIEYDRAKTGKPYSIKIEPEMKPYIDKFLVEDATMNLRARTVHGMTIALNRHLHRIAGITSYWSRHSWATIAASLDIPKDIIALALGHGGNSVTDIYIEFDMKKVDEANRKVIDYVWYDKL